MMVLELGGKEVVLKHDVMLELSCKFGSIDEHRFLNSCLVNNYQRIAFEEKTYYAVDVASYAKKQSIGLAKAFREVVDLATKYKETTFQIKLDKNITWYTSLIYDFVIDEKLYTVEVQWNKKIIPLISGEMEKGKFSLYDGRMDRIPSSKRYALSELLQRNLWQLKKKPYFELTVRDIRDMLGMQEGEYPLFSEFNRSVIKPTLKDLEKHLNIKLQVKGNRHKVRFSLEEV